MQFDICDRANLIWQLYSRDAYYLIWCCCHVLPKFVSLLQLVMYFRRILVGLAAVTVAAFFCAQSVEAAKGPKITHKVYFDIKHGDKDLGRSE